MISVVFANHKNEKYAFDNLYKYKIDKSENYVEFKSAIINDEISFQKKSSFNDFEIGSKFRILENDEKNTNIGFLTYLSIPTAPEVFSYNEYGFINKLLFS